MWLSEGSRLDVREGVVLPSKQVHLSQVLHESWVCSFGYSRRVYSTPV